MSAGYSLDIELSVDAFKKQQNTFLFKPAYFYYLLFTKLLTEVVWHYIYKHVLKLFFLSLLFLCSVLIHVIHKELV